MPGESCLLHQHTRCRGSRGRPRQGEGSSRWALTALPRRLGALGRRAGSNRSAQRPRGRPRGIAWGRAAGGARGCLQELAGKRRPGLGLEGWVGWGWVSSGGALRSHRRVTCSQLWDVVPPARAEVAGWPLSQGWFEGRLQELACPGTQAMWAGGCGFLTYQDISHGLANQEDGIKRICKHVHRTPGQSRHPRRRGPKRMNGALRAAWHALLWRGGS